MRICYLSGAHSPHTKKWAEFFADKGHEIHVISFDHGEISNANLHYIDMNISWDSKSISKFKYIFALNNIKKLLNKIKPDIIHAHRVTGYALLASLANYHPYVLSVWGSDIYDFPEQSIFHKKLVKYNLNKADYIFSTSHAMKRQIQRYIDKEVEVTPFGVDTSIFKPLEDSYKKSSGGKLVVGTVKTLEPKYGIEYLIKAFAIVKNKYPEYCLELIIGGAGSQEKHLKELVKDLNIQDSVKFIGYINQNEVINAFNSMDIAVFPSILESFGVAAVEAQACGTPVIISNVGGLKEATFDGSRMIVNIQDENDLARAIGKLINNKELRIEMGKKARAFVEDNYNIEDNFNKVEELYYKFAGSYNKG